jgi:hypothetical protein
MKALVVVVTLFALSSLGLGAIMSHGPQLNAISWSTGTLGTADDWSQDIRLTDARLDSTQPVVARDARGDLHIAWSDDRTGDSEIYYKKVDTAGKVLVADERLTTTASRSIYPTMAVDSFGGAHIAWLDDRGGMWNIYYARLANDGSVVVSGLQLTSLRPGPQEPTENSLLPQPIARINHLATLADTEGLRPSIAVDELGSVHIAWCDFRNGNSEVRYSVIDQEGRISVDQKGISLGASDSYNVVIRAVGDEMVILWAERSKETNRLYFSRMDLQGDCTVGPKNFFTDISSMMAMDAAVDAEGITRLVWSSDHYVKYDLFYMRLSPDGDPLERETQITRSVIDSMHPSLAVNSSGGVHLVWSEQQDRLKGDQSARSEIFYAVIGPDGRASSPPFRLTSSPFRSWGPSIALSENDLPSVVWSDCRAGATNSELYLKTQVEVSVNDVESGSAVVATPGRDYMPAVAAAGGIGVLAAVVAAAGKYKLSVLAIPLYSRLK